MQEYCDCRERDEAGDRSRGFAGCSDSSRPHVELAWIECECLRGGVHDPRRSVCSRTAVNVAQLARTVEQARQHAERWKDHDEQQRQKFTASSVADEEMEEAG